MVIRDEGCGIADVEKAMQPFYSTGDGAERSGMGFCVMQTFMDAVEVDSAVDRGTTVTMRKYITGEVGLHRERMLDEIGLTGRNARTTDWRYIAPSAFSGEGCLARSSSERPRRRCCGPPPDSMPAGACASRPMPSPLCWVRCASYAGARAPCTCPAPRRVSSPRWESARGKLNAREGREPTVRELAQAVGVEPGLLGEMLAARDRMRRADGALDVQTASATGEGFEDWVLLKDTLTRLPSPYAQVLWLRFGQGWSQARLAERFGVGQPQISRWNARERNCSDRRWISTRPVRTCDPPQIPDLTTRRPVLQRTGRRSVCKKRLIKPLRRLSNAKSSGFL